MWVRYKGWSSGKGGLIKNGGVFNRGNSHKEWGLITIAGRSGGIIISSDCGTVFIELPMNSQTKVRT